MRYTGKYLDQKTMINFYYFFLSSSYQWNCTKEQDFVILQKKALRIILKFKNTDFGSDSFRELQIMPIKMLFEYRFLI